MSTTNDSEDWLSKILREIYDRLATEDTGIDDDYFIEDTDYKKRIFAHYAHYLKPEDVERAVAEAEQRGMRKVLDLKKARPCPACNDISLIPNDDIGTICVKCKATYPF